MTLTPKNWETFQHYKDRSPIWIKLHRNLLDNYDFFCLPVASRALAPMLWLLASEYDAGGITASRDEIAFRLRMTREALDDALNPLIEADFFIEASRPLAGRKRGASLEREKEKEKEKKGGVGTRARAKECEPSKPSRPLDPAAETKLIGGALFKRFCAAYPAKRIHGAAREKFLALLAAGENADAIIGAVHETASSQVPAEEWLDQRPWKQSAPAPQPTPERAISPEANALADELAVIAGQDLDFLEPGWCGAAWRCQRWLNEGYPRELIVSGVKSMVASKRPEKINTIAYFDKGLARYIAQQTKPVPKVIEQKAEVILASPHVRPVTSWQAARDRKREALREFKEHVASATGG